MNETPFEVRHRKRPMPGCASCACFAAALASSPSNGLPQSLHVLRKLTTQPEEEDATGNGTDSYERLGEVDVLAHEGDTGVVVENVLAERVDVAIGDRVGDRRGCRTGGGGDAEDLEGTVHDDLGVLAPDRHLVAFLLLGHYFHVSMCLDRLHRRKALRLRCVPPQWGHFFRCAMTAPDPKGRRNYLKRISPQVAHR